MAIKEIKFNFYYNYYPEKFNIIEKKIKIKPYYNLNKIEELFESYFVSAVNSQPYCPKELNTKQLICNIENYENNLSELINNIFEKLMKDISYEQRIYR